MPSITINNYLYGLRFTTHPRNSVQFFTMKDRFDKFTISCVSLNGLIITPTTKGHVSVKYKELDYVSQYVILYFRDDYLIVEMVNNGNPGVLFEVNG